jgi:hypothetical protein
MTIFFHISSFYCCCRHYWMHKNIELLPGRPVNKVHRRRIVSNKIWPARFFIKPPWRGATWGLSGAIPHASHSDQRDICFGHLFQLNIPQNLITIFSAGFFD